MNKIIVILTLLISVNSYADVFAPIPMPQSGMDAFASGMASSQSVFDSIAQNRLIQQQAMQQERVEEKETPILYCVGAKSSGKALHVSIDIIANTININGYIVKIKTTIPEEKFLFIVSENSIDNTGEYTYSEFYLAKNKARSAKLLHYNAVNNKKLFIANVACRLID